MKAVTAPCCVWRRSINRLLPSAPLEIPAGFIWKTGVCGLASDGTLVFDSELKQGDKIRIYLEVKCPPKSHGISLVTNAGAPLESFKLYNWNRFISFEGAGGENGRVTISLLAGDLGTGFTAPFLPALRVWLTVMALTRSPVLTYLRKLPFIRRLKAARKPPHDGVRRAHVSRALHDPGSKEVKVSTKIWR